MIKRTSFHQIHKFFSVKTTSFVDKAKLTEHTFMIVVAILIGTLAGFVAIGIRAMIKGILYLSFLGTGNILGNIIHSPWYIVLL